MKNGIVGLFLLGCVGIKAQIIPKGSEGQSALATAAGTEARFSGLMSFAVPILSTTSKDIPINISLNYVAQGIKVGEEASSVGLGWNLKAGGAITQVVRGLNDVECNGFIPKSSYFCTATNPRDSVPPRDGGSSNGGRRLEEACSPSPGPYDQLINLGTRQGEQPIVFNGCTQNPCPASADWKTEADKEPDVYYFDFLGFSGTFCFDRSGAVQQLYKSNLKFSFDLATGTFTVVTDNGLQVLFKEIEAGKINVSETYVYHRDKFEGQGQTLSAGFTWYLTEIKSLVTNEVVLFKYITTLNEVHTLYYSEAEVNRVNKYSVTTGDVQVAYGSITSRDAEAICRNNFPYSLSTQTAFVSRKNKYLQYIEYPSGKVEFGYAEREDIPNAKRLGYVKVYSLVDQKYVPKSKWNLGHGYFLSNANQNPSTSRFSTTVKGVTPNVVLDKRLKLVSVSQEVVPYTLSAPSMVPDQYSFLYEEPSALSMPYKNSLNVDFYGFYNFNGVTHNQYSLSGQNRSTLAMAAKVGLLTMIAKPGGNKLNYQYDVLEGCIRMAGISESNSTGSILYKKSFSYYNPTLVAPDKEPVGLNSVITDGTTKVRCKNYVSLSYNGYDFVGITYKWAYDSIVELHGEAGGGGKIVYVFPSIVMDDIFPLSYYKKCSNNVCAYTKDLPRSYPLYLRPYVGQPISKRIYKRVGSTYSIIAKEEYEYTYDETVSTIAGFILSEKNTCSFESYKYFAYWIPQFWINVKEIRTTSYADDASSEMTKTMSLTYNPLNKQVNRIITNTSDPNRRLVSQVYYPVDYVSTTGAVGLLKANNLVNMPIENLQLEEITSGTSVSKNVIGGKLVSYHTTYPGLPVAEHKLDLASPLACGSFFAQNGQNACDIPNTGNMTVVPNYYRKTIDFIYNADRNLVETVKGGQLYESSVWGYGNRRIIGRAVNSRLDQLACTSFEEGLPANWQNDEPTILYDSFSGYKSIAVAKGVSNYGPCVSILPASQKGKYKAGVWMKYAGTANATFSLFTVKKSSLASNVAFPANSTVSSKSFHLPNTNGQWKYIELELDLDEVKKLAAVQSMTPQEDLGIRAVILNNDANHDVLVDEMRVLPTDAMLTTFTYDPFVGQTSEVKPNGNKVDTEYNHLGVPYLQRDLQGNITSIKESYFKK